MLYNVKIHAKKRGVPPKNRSYLLHTVCYSYLCVLYVTILAGYKWYIRREVFTHKSIAFRSLKCISVIAVQDLRRNVNQ